jgi:hypothetical protein
MNYHDTLRLNGRGQGKIPGSVRPHPLSPAPRGIKAGGSMNARPALWCAKHNGGPDRRFACGQHNHSGGTRAFPHFYFNRPGPSLFWQRSRTRPHVSLLFNLDLKRRRPGLHWDFQTKFAGLAKTAKHRRECHLGIDVSLLHDKAIQRLSGLGVRNVS